MGTLFQTRFLTYFPMLIFALLSFRFLLVYLGAVPTPLALAALGGSAILSVLVWFRAGFIICLYIASVPLVAGIQNLGYLKMAPVLEFGFAVIFLAWLSKKMIGKTSQIEAGSDIEHASDMLAVIVMISLAAGVGLYPGDFVLYRLKFPTVSGMEDPFWMMEASFILLMGIFLFRMLLVEYGSCEKFVPVLIRVLGLQVCIILAFAGYDMLSKSHFSSFLSFLSVRPYLPFNNPHSIGNLLTLYFFFFVSLIQYQKKKTLLFLTGVVCLIFAIIFLTKSRSSLVAILVVVSGIYFFKFSGKFKLTGLLFICLLMIMLNCNGDKVKQSLSHLNSPLRPHLQRILQMMIVADFSKNRSITSRLALFRNAIRVSKEYPVTGAGIGSFYRISPYYQKQDEKKLVRYGSRETRNAHNYYLQLAAEIGIPGLIVFLFIIGLSIMAGVRALIDPNLSLPVSPSMEKGAGGEVLNGNSISATPPKQMRADKDPPHGTRGLVWGISALLVTLIFDHTLLLATHQIVFWFVLAALVITGKGKHTEWFSHKNRRVLTSCAVLIVILFAWGYHQKITIRHPEKYEYGYYTPYQKIQGNMMRWTMHHSCTEVLATSDDFKLSMWADPNNLAAQKMRVNIYINNTRIDQLLWNKKELKVREYHVPDMPDVKVKYIKIEMITNEGYNPFKLGLTKNIRENRDQSLAVGDVRFF